MSTTPPVPTPDQNAPAQAAQNVNTNAQGTSNPPAALPTNNSTDPSQAQAITPQSDPAANAAPSQQMVSNAQTSQAQPAQPSQTTTTTTGATPAASLNSANPAVQTPVSALSPLQPQPDHPSVQRAGILRSIATALAGGPRFTTQIDPTTGATTRTQVPLSRGDLAMAIVSEALSGGLAGLGVKPGPGVVGRAAAAGAGQVQGEMQDADKANQDQAQQDFKNQVFSKAQQANNLEVAGRTVLLNAQAEKEGLDNSQTLIKMDADAIQNAQDHGDVQETGVSQADLLAGQKSGKYNAAQQSFYHDGVTTLNGKPEATFTVAANPNRPATMTQAQYDQYASYDIPGFTKGTKIPAGGFQVKQNMLDNWNRQVATQDTMQQETGDVVTHLSNSPAYKGQAAEVQSNLAKAWDDPVFKRAMVNALPSVSHSHPDEPLADAVARLGAPYVQNADGKWVPNSGARIAAAQAIYGGFGGGDTAKGKQFLQDEKDATAPTPIKTLGQAEGIIADPTSSPKAVADAQAAKTQMLADKAAGKASGAAGAGGAGGNSSDAEDIADGIIHGTNPPVLKGLYRQTAAVEAALSRKHYPLAQAQLDYGATQRRLSTLNGTQQTRLQQAVETSYQGVDLLQQRYDAWKKAVGGISGFQTLNAASLRASENLPGAAGAAAHALQAQIADQTSELAVVYQGGNSPTDHAMELAAQNISGNWNEAAFNQALTNMRQNIGIRRNSILSSAQPIGVSSNSPYLHAGTPTTSGGGSNPQVQQFAYKTADGKQGWDGTKWVPIGGGK
jgi:hypothetical protein